MAHNFSDISFDKVQDIQQEMREQTKLRNFLSILTEFKKFPSDLFGKTYTIEGTIGKEPVHLTITDKGENMKAYHTLLQYLIEEGKKNK